MNDKQEPQTDWLRDILTRQEKEIGERTDLAQKFATDATLRAKFLAVTFRCHIRTGKKESCVLAYVYNTVHGIIVHTPAYKLSPTLNDETSSEKGRAKYTRDGGASWNASTRFLSDVLGALPVNCRHVQQVPLTVGEIEKAARGKQRTITVTPGAGKS